MHDLNTIRRLNQTAFSDSIGNFQRQGRHVVATYEGLALFGIETFTDSELAKAAQAAPTDVGQTRQLFFPTGPLVTAHAEPLMRDQSEDRALRAAQANA